MGFPIWMCGSLAQAPHAHFLISAARLLPTVGLQISKAYAREKKELFGLNMSGSEFSYGTYPSNDDLDYVRSKGIIIIRLPISWELMQPILYDSFNKTYLVGLQKTLSAAAVRGMSVIVDLHNYGRYNGGIGITTDDTRAGNGQGKTVGSASVPIDAFTDFWSKLADVLKNQPGIYAYDIMNEPHDMGDGQRNDMTDSSIWTRAAQAAVNSIRKVDMDTTIMVEGTNYSSAISWLRHNSNFVINDPANKLLYEAHQYFDGPRGGGKYKLSYDGQGAYPNIGVDLIQPWLRWLERNRFQGFLGEFGVPNDDPRWNTVLNNVLTHLNANGVSGAVWAYRNQAQWWPSPLFVNPVGGQDASQLATLIAHMN